MPSTNYWLFHLVDCNSQVTNYRLVGVICHLGNSLGGGHYVSYCASPSNKWYEFDDRVVTKVPVETVANVEAYVLLYQYVSSSVAFGLHC
jgi:ubiquitin C-terminal hydrolase